MDAWADWVYALVNKYSLIYIAPAEECYQKYLIATYIVQPGLM